MDKVSKRLLNISARFLTSEVHKSQHILPQPTISLVVSSLIKKSKMFCYMKYLYWVALLWISCFPLMGQDWTPYRDPEGAFSVSMPCVWQTHTDTIKTAVGELLYHTFFCQTVDTSANELYMLSYCDYPLGTLHSDSTALLAAFFEETMASAAFSINGKLMYQTDESVQNFPGKFWRIDYRRGEAVIKTLAFVVKNRYYALLVVSKKKFHINPDSDRFFDGFKLHAF